MKQHIYKVNGMHCASCEILIEKKLLEIDDVKSVDASTSKGEVVVNSENEKPSLHKLNEMFKKENYTFSEIQNIANENQQKNKKGMNSTLVAFDIALVIIVLFLFLNISGVSGLLNVSSGSSLATFLGLGLLAGISSCAALVGGIVLSMSKQWSELYSNPSNSSKQATTSQKLQPHIMFNVGRIVSYAVLGGILGMIGSKLQISFQFTSFLVIVVSFLMIALGLQMLGVKALRKFQFSLPKSMTRNIADESNFSGKYMPFAMGALTFFLPCGFTITAQGLAMASGDPLRGALIMSSFALGTAPMLLFIGLSSTKLYEKTHLAANFMKLIGILVIIFGLSTVNMQLVALGLPNTN